MFFEFIGIAHKKSPFTNCPVKGGTYRLFFCKLISDAASQLVLSSFLSLFQKGCQFSPMGLAGFDYWFPVFRFAYPGNIHYTACVQNSAKVHTAELCQLCRWKHIAVHGMALYFAFCICIIRSTGGTGDNQCFPPQPCPGTAIGKSMGKYIINIFLQQCRIGIPVNRELQDNSICCCKGFLFGFNIKLPVRI